MRGLTFGRLRTMSDGRHRFAWNLTANLLAELMNGPRGRHDKRAWTAGDLDPYAKFQHPTTKMPATEFLQQLAAAWL